MVPFALALLQLSLSIATRSANAASEPPPPIQRWYADADADGYGDPASTALGRVQPPGYVRNASDCDDTDADVYPGAVELCDDVQQDCSNHSWTQDRKVATFYPASGGWEDWTDDLAAGVSGSPVVVDLSENGELVICDGTWYVDLVVTGHAVSITGLHGAAQTVLSGGGVTAVLEVVRDHAMVVATGLRMTDGNGCFGAAVTTFDVSECSPAGASAAWMNDITLALVDDRIEGNSPTNVSRTGIIGVANTTLTLDDTTIANNSDTAIYSDESHITCNGDPSNDAGIWGNSAGLFLWGGSAGSATFESNDCDFDGVGGRFTPRYDVRVETYSRYTPYRRFGDDETFRCDAAALTCTH